MHLETERLLIRPWRHEDAERLLDLLSRLEVVKWLGDGEPVVMKDLHEAHARIDRYAERDAPPLGIWAVERTSDGLIVGTVLLLTLPNAEHGEVEIGWHLHPAAWGNGYATEAGAALIERAWQHGLSEVYAVVYPDNAASQAVCRRLGMEHLGLTERYYDISCELFRLRR